MHDMVIRGGTLVDGTGAAAREADVVIDGERVTAVIERVRGAAAPRGQQEIDARGLLVTPGFVDIHTHYDAQATWDPLLLPSGCHGCTTVVMGSCGVGFAPARPERREWLINLMEGVEDLPGSALVEGIKWDWESFPEYLDALARMPRALDVGAQLAHGPLRGYVMGERGAKNEAATGEDIEQMAGLVEQAMRAGAMGFSTSRTPLHRALDGEPVPGTTASLDEVMALGAAMGRAGSGVFQAAIEHAQVPASIPWLARLSRESGRPVTFNLSQIDEEPELWREGLALLDAERSPNAAGGAARLFAQVAGRAIGIVMGLGTTAHPFVLSQSFLEIMGEPREEQRRLLRNPELQARLLAEEPFVLEGPQALIAKLVTTRFERMFALDNDGDGYEPPPSSSLAAQAAARGVHPRTIALEAMLEGRFLYAPLFNYAAGSLDVLKELHDHPGTVLGLGDAGAHCGAICDGAMPTFMLTHWARDRAGPRMPLERVVARQTRDTARLFGLHDRGAIVPGLKADVNVIDLEKLAVQPVQLVNDLPAGGRRLLQKARGYRNTIVSGVVTVENDTPTGAVPGRLVRGAAG